MAQDLTQLSFKHGPDQVAIDLDKAKRGICPECDADLTVHDPEAHAENHWDTRTLNETLPSDAHRRKALVLAYGRTHPRAQQPKPADMRSMIESQVSQAMEVKEES